MSTLDGWDFGIVVFGGKRVLFMYVCSTNPSLITPLSNFKYLEKFNTDEILPMHSCLFLVFW